MILSDGAVQPWFYACILSEMAIRTVEGISDGGAEPKTTDPFSTSTIKKLPKRSQHLHPQWHTTRS